MNDAMAAEWHKLRTVRSTHRILGAPLLALLAGAAVAALMTADWDGASAADRAGFAGADPGVLAVPFTQFCMAAFGALLITSEYATGLIRTSLAAVPDRRRLLAAKAAVAGAVALASGQAVALGALLLGRLIAGDRPAPIAAWESVPDGLPTALAQGLSVAVVALVGLAVGAALRSTAATFVAIGVLLFVLPIAARMVVPAWGERIASLMPTGLAPQLAGTADDPALPPAAALAMMAAYALLPLVVAARAFTRRDA